MLSDLTYLYPELILLLGATLVLALDALWYKRHASDRGRLRWLPILALLTLAAAGLALIPGWGANKPLLTMLSADAFTTFFKALALIGVALVILIAKPYLAGRTRYHGEFYALLLATGLAVCLAAGATNLVMIYLGMEFLSITSYILAGFLREDKKSGEAALKYFLYGSTASAVMLYGMSLLYGATGTTDLAQIAAALLAKPAADMLWISAPAIFMLIVGFGFKASLVPFHQWAPDTYEGAPTPVTAFLSTVSKATGFAIMMRVFLVAFGAGLSAGVPVYLPAARWVAVLVSLAVLTMTLGNLTALRQTNIKRLLAYSSIAQAGYMVIGLAALQAQPGRAFSGVNGVLIYLLAYLFTNLGAFAVVTAIENATGQVEVKAYAGLARRAPALAALLLIFLLSLAGIPPTGGFIGKFYVFGAAVQNQLWVLVAIAAVNSVIAAFYYLNIVRYMYFVPAADADAEAVQVAPSLQGALALTAAATLLIGLAPAPLIAWARHSAEALLFALR